jgi:hypothetical protein
MLARKTTAALAARRDGPDQNAVANFVTGHARPQFLNDANRFVTDDQAGSHRILAAHNVQIRSANSRERDANDSLANPRVRPRHFFHPNVIHSPEYGGLHRVHIGVTIPLLAQGDYTRVANA